MWLKGAKNGKVEQNIGEIAPQTAPLLTINLINFFYNPFIITWDGMAIQI